MSGCDGHERRRADVLGRAVVAAAVALESAQDELCRLDSVAGDGDEGLGMARAARAVRQRLAGGLITEVSEIVDVVATELSAIGGAMGALSYVIVGSIGEDLKAHRAEGLSATRLAKILAIAECSVSDFGGAKRGDKSIVDSIGAARDAARAIC